MSEKIEAPKRIRLDITTMQSIAVSDSGTTIDRSKHAMYIRADIAEAEAKKNVVDVLERIKYHFLPEDIPSRLINIHTEYWVQYINKLIHEVSK